MSVYVDNFYLIGGLYRNMRMSHLVADTTEELLQMADAIGVDRKWIQHPGTPNEHFDICLAMRTKAVRLHAVEIGYRDYARFVQKRAADNGIDSARASVDLIRN